MSTSYLSDAIAVSDGGQTPTHYSTVDLANTYFATQLNKTLWAESSATDKEKALTMATQAIDALNFAGTKADEDQVLQFPRGTDVEVPIAIKWACYECAYQFLDGIDIDQEIENLGVLAQGYSGVRTTYDRAFILEHLRAGIPSSKAWGYLKPFLRDTKAIVLSRVS